MTTITQLTENSEKPCAAHRQQLSGAGRMRYRCCEMKEKQYGDCRPCLESEVL
ncbi:hypothetical protein HPP92_017496 [Vanilla planifolia]|uniref:Uncharacterized protein n=1 Tax=Vanilla planifolia TaxID=51239 RepID=A0A835QCW8_VANPL|nr:hypothetical protein HPP92_017496 [Vanilla planifolia]